MEATLWRTGLLRNNPLLERHRLSALRPRPIPLQAVLLLLGDSPGHQTMIGLISPREQTMVGRAVVFLGIEIGIRRVVAVKLLMVHNCLFWGSWVSYYYLPEFLM